jgi:hypothetical protein
MMLSMSLISALCLSRHSLNAALSQLGGRPGPVVRSPTSKRAPRDMVPAAVWQETSVRLYVG